MSLCLPSLVIIRLELPDGRPLRLANILFSIQTFATRKNDISLFPFASDAEGIVRITKDEMRAEVAATYDSGVMDYSAIESAFDMVEIRISSVSEIQRVISGRTKAWTSLLAGEKERWKTMEEFISLLKSATNAQLAIPEELSLRPKIRDSWLKQDATYEYEMCIRKRLHD
jgi:hypothetical protein